MYGYAIFTGVVSPVTDQNIVIYSLIDGGSVGKRAPAIHHLFSLF